MPHRFSCSPFAVEGRNLWPEPERSAEITREHGNGAHRICGPYRDT